MSSIVLTTVTKPLVAAPFWEILEVTGILVVRSRARIADTVDASDVVLDKFEVLKNAGSS